MVFLSDDGAVDRYERDTQWGFSARQIFGSQILDTRAQTN
jgi:hypothetical protein